MIITMIMSLAMVGGFLSTQAQGPVTVTVNTTANTVDGNTSNVNSLLNNPGDDGMISFLEALTAVNRSGPGHTINFNLSAGATISLEFTESLTAGSTVIDGDVDGDGTPDVVLKGPPGFHVLSVESANNSIQNLVITALSIDGEDAHHNRVDNCYMGTDVNGTASRNEDANGLEIENGAHHNVVENNIIAGNAGPDPNTSNAGILLFSGAHNNQIRGNWIGVGTNRAALPNEIGIFISDGSYQNEVGGPFSGACTNPCNVISGNSGSGLIIEDPGTIENRVLGNYFGVSPDGATPLLNGHSGVVISNGATQNRVGGERTTAACEGPCNVISGNTEAGVAMRDSGTISNTVLGNFIGVRPDGTAAMANGEVGVAIQAGAAHNTIGGARSGTFCDGPCNVISGNGAVGLRINGDGTISNTIAGNYIGLNASGTASTGNRFSGIQIGEGAQQNLVGGVRAAATCDGPCNVISGNGQSGLLIWGQNTNANLVQGNFIGVNATATAKMPNRQHGVHLATEVIRLPTLAAAAGQEVNLDTQTVVFAPESTALPGQVTALRMPSTAAQIPDSPTAEQPVSAAVQETAQQATPVRIDNQIGGNMPGAGNLISGNRQEGINLEGAGTRQTRVQGNLIGTELNGNDAGLGNGTYGILVISAAENQIGGDTAEGGNSIAYNTSHGVLLIQADTLSNTIRHNSIHHNGGFGIFLANDAQGGLKPPALVANTTRAKGTGAPPTGTIDVYIADAPRSGGVDGNGEGMTWVGSGTADANGHFDFAISGVDMDDLLTATATDPAGNTSQFSYQPKLVGLEVTQAIQNLRNSVLLVEDKPAFVRAHLGPVPASSGAVGAPVTGELVGHREGGELAGSPLAVQNQGGHIKLKRFPFEWELDDSLYFELPANWQQGTVELEFRNLAFRCAEPANVMDNAKADDVPNDCWATAIFREAAAPEITLVPLIWEDDNGGEHAPDQTDLQYVVQELEAVYPITELDWQFYPAAVPAPGFLGQGRPSTTVEFFGWLRILDLLQTLDLCLAGCPRYHVGIFDDDDPQLFGIKGMAVSPFAENGLGAVAAGFLDNDFLVSHEVGHLANRRHVDCAGSEANTDGNYPYPSGLITQEKTGPDIFNGFDIRSNPPSFPWDNPYRFQKKVRPGWASSDFMSYCGGAWISDYTYRHINTYLLARFGPAATLAATPASDARATVSTVIVSGIVSPTYGTGVLAPIYALDAPGPLTPPAPGSYTIRFEDAQGQALASHSFEPPIASEASAGDARAFVLVLPAVNGTQRVVLLHQDKQLDVLTVSATAPTVTLLAPNGGETLAPGTSTVRWSASDADGNSLTYSVQVSVDGGATWRTLVADWTSTTYELDLNWLPGAEQMLLRVLATDGFHTAQDASDTAFTVPNHAPQVWIETPADEAIYVGEQMILLRGRAYDLEEGLLAGAALRWQSDLDGELGAGGALAVNAATLTAGAHTITLSSQDSANAAAAATIRLQVHRARPTFPAQLSVQPAFFPVTAAVDDTQIISQEITVRNEGDGDWSWSASDANGDQEWISLQAAAGNGPGAFVMEVDPTGLAVGEHTASILVTATQGAAAIANSPLSVTVSLYLLPGATTDSTPLPNSHYAGPETSITLRAGVPLDPASVGTDTFIAHGMQTGRLPEIYHVEGAQATLVPIGLFKVGEIVQVVATDGLRAEQNAAQNGPTNGPTVWQFRVATTAAGAGLFVHSGGQWTPQTGAPEIIAYGPIVLGDLDGDDDLDAFQNGVPTDRIWLNQGRGIFVDSGQALSERGGSATALGDLDGDGDLDAFVAYFGFANQIYRNQGDGTFAGPEELPQPNGLPTLNQTVALGDLDGDGDLDAFLGNRGANSVWFNNGNSGFADSGQELLAYRFSDETTETHKVVLADLDEDGDLDAYNANRLYDEGDRRTQGWPDAIWANDGAGNFSLDGNSGSYGLNDVALGDLDGDGKLDIFQAGAALHIVYSGPKGSRFLYRPNDNRTPALGSGVELGDVDGDGDLDAVVQTAIGGELWLNDGQGNFSTVRNLDQRFISGATLGDVDGDGDLDAVLVSPRGPNQVWWNLQSGEDTGASLEPAIFLPFVGP